MTLAKHDYSKVDAILEAFEWGAMILFLRARLHLAEGPPEVFLTASALASAQFDKSLSCSFPIYWSNSFFFFWNCSFLTDFESLTTGIFVILVITTTLQCITYKVTKNVMALHGPNEMCIGKWSCRASVFLPSSDLSLSKSYEGEKLMQGKIIFTMHMELGPCNAITFLVTL